MSSSQPKTALIRQPTPIYLSLWYYLFSTYLKWDVTRRITAFQRSVPQFWSPIAPAFTKSYPVCPDLTHRFFLPPGHTPRTTTTYPLIILLHGGGWTFGFTSMDDQQATLLASRGYLVVSVQYPLARFPEPIESIERTIHCVLSDTCLPLPPTGPLVLAGFSAGGAMALSLAQLPSLRERVSAVVSFFPRTDFSRSPRALTYRTTAWGEGDVLERTLGLFDWAYVPAGQDLRDPLLSPAYASRKELRAAVCVVTGEMDCLAGEASVMARRLAGRHGEEEGDFGEDWEDGGVKYICGRGMPHGFTHFWVRPAGEWAGRKEEEVRRTWGEVLGWLEKVVKNQGEGKGLMVPEGGMSS